MRSPGISGERELRGQPANPGSPGKMAVEVECACVCMLCFDGVGWVSGRATSLKKILYFFFIIHTVDLHSDKLVDGCWFLCNRPMLVEITLCRFHQRPPKENP